MLSQLFDPFDQEKILYFHSGTGVPGSPLLFINSSGVDTIGVSGTTYLRSRAAVDVGELESNYLTLSGNGTIRYVNFATGKDYNGGSESLPLKNLNYASAIAAQGDTIVVSSTSVNPIRGGFLSNNDGTLAEPIVFYGDDWFLTNTIDISTGADIGDFLKDTGFDAWKEGGVPWDWELTPNDSTAEKSTVHDTGAFSVLLNKSGATTPAFKKDYLYLPGNTPVTITIRHKEGASKPYFQLRDVTTNTYLRPDLSWGVAASISTVTTASFADFAFSFTTNSTGRYLLTITFSYAGNCYIDNVSLKVDAEQYSWSKISNYYKSNIPVPQTAKVLATCSTSDWESFGMESLELSSKVASLAACDETANTWFQGDDGYIYYNPGEGDIATTHIEIGQPGIETEPQPDAAVQIVNDYTYLANANVYFSNGKGIYVAHDNCKLLSPVVVNSAGSGIDYLSAGYIGDARILSCGHGHFKGIFARGAGKTLTIKRTTIDKAGDDGLQVFNGCHVDADFIIVSRSGQYPENRNGFGIDVEGAGSSLTISNFVVNNNYYAAGLHSELDTTLVCHNGIVTGNDGINDGHRDIGVYGAVTADNMCYGTAAGDNFSPITYTTEDPLFVDVQNQNYQLMPLSPCSSLGAIRYSDGDGDQYDLGGYKIWSDTTDAADNHALYGWSIGAYQYPHAGGNPAKCFYHAEIASGTTWDDLVFKALPFSKLVNADDGKLFTAGVANEIDATDRESWTGDQFFNSDDREQAAVYNEDLTGTDLIKADKYFGTI